MSADSALRIWDKENRDQYGLVNGSDLGDALKSHRVVFTQIVLVEQLWAHLQQMNAVDSNEVATLKYNAPNHEIASRLVDVMMRSPRWKFHALMRALHQTNQDHVIHAIGLKIDDYR